MPTNCKKLKSLVVETTNHFEVGSVDVATVMTLPFGPTPLVRCKLRETKCFVEFTSLCSGIDSSIDDTVDDLILVIENPVVIEY